MNPIQILTVKTRQLDARALETLLKEFDAMQLGEEATPLILDLGGVEYIDSLGVSVLVSIRRKRHGRQVALTGLKGFVATVARVSHLAQIFDVFPTVADAESAFLKRAS